MAAVRATPTLVEHTTNRDKHMTALAKRFDLVCEGQRGLTCADLRSGCAMTRRLIETWLPIAALGDRKSCASGRSMTALSRQPTTVFTYGGHADRLVASRAAVLASLLPEDADHGKVSAYAGIHGDRGSRKADVSKFHPPQRRAIRRAMPTAIPVHSPMYQLMRSVRQELGSNRIRSIGMTSSRLQSLIQPREAGQHPFRVSARLGFDYFR
jgi:hypothetical protein